MSWNKIAVDKNQLNLSLTLLGGQSFRWIKVQNNEETFLGVFANIVWRLKQNDKFLLYKVEAEAHSDEDFVLTKFTETENSMELNKRCPSYYENLLKTYLRLDINLHDLYRQWEMSHLHFKEISSEKFSGVRVLNQAPLENIISFICSQNNNIKRISSMVAKFCELFGKKIKQVEVNWYTFPNLDDLQDAKMEEKLREAKFGYRAKYIAACVQQIRENGGITWCKDLQNMSYKEAHKKLLSLQGIGPKVADCICLMSLNHLQAIPVDTHVHQIAQRHYLPELKSTKSVTREIYEKIGDTFRNTYGDYAGWAQTVLFCADLRQFQELKRSNTDVEQKLKKIKK